MEPKGVSPWGRHLNVSFINPSNFIQRLNIDNNHFKHQLKQASHAFYVGTGSGNGSGTGIGKESEISVNVKHETIESITE